MNGTLSHIAKDYLRELRRHLYEYKVDDATSAALLADAREGLTGLDDDAAAEQIGRLGRAELADLVTRRRTFQQQEEITWKKSG